MLTAYNRSEENLSCTYMRKINETLTYKLLIIIISANSKILRAKRNKSISNGQA